LVLCFGGGFASILLFEGIKMLRQQLMDWTNHAL